MCGHSFTVEPGKINYWGRCIIEIEYNILNKKLIIISFTIVNEVEEDISAFKKTNPNLSNMEVANNIGKRIVITK
jgi:hypothetical protein